MAFGKMENPMDLDFIMLRIFFIWDNSKMESSMGKESSISAMEYIKGFLLLVNEKGKDFYLMKKTNVMKETSRKVLNTVMVNGCHFIVLRNMKVSSKMVKNKELESYKNTINTTIKDCLQKINQMEPASIIKLMR